MRARSVTMRASPMKHLGLNGDPVCRPIRLPLSSYLSGLRCQPLKSNAPGASGNAAAHILGRLRSRKLFRSARHSKSFFIHPRCFFAGDQCHRLMPSLQRGRAGHRLDRDTAAAAQAPPQQTMQPPLVIVRRPIPRSGLRRAPAAAAPRRRWTDKNQVRRSRRRAHHAGRNRAPPERVRQLSGEAM